MSITIDITDTEYKALEYVCVSPEEWADNAVKNRARKAKEEILALLIKYCNTNSIALAVGEDAQVNQAFELGIVAKGSKEF